VVLHDEVQLAGLPVQQEVANGAADEAHALVRSELPEQPPATRHGPQRVDRLGGAPHSGIVTFTLMGMFSSLRGHGRRRWFVIGGVLLAVVAAGVVAAVLLTRQPGNVSHPDVEFTAEPPPPAPAIQKTKNPFDDGFTWSNYHS